MPIGLARIDANERWDLITGLKKAGKPTVLSAQEAQQYGIDLSEDIDNWQDWYVKASPTDTGELSWSLISPDSFEIFEDNSILTPEGQRYSREEWDARIGSQAMEYTNYRDDIVPTLQAVFGPETTIANPLYSPAYPSSPTVDFDLSKLDPDTAMVTLRNWLTEYPDEFVGAIREKGWTPDTERLMRILMPDITESDLALTFGQIPEEGIRIEPQMLPAIEPAQADIGIAGPEYAGVVAKLNQQELEANYGKVEFQPTIIIKPDNKVFYEGYDQQVGTFDPKTGQIEPVYDYVMPKERSWVSKFFFGRETPEKPIAGDDVVFRSIVAGLGDIIATTGAALRAYGRELEFPMIPGQEGVPVDLRWLGENGVGTWLSEFGEVLQYQGPPDTLGKFGWQMLYNPRFYATRVARTVPFSLALIIPSLLAGAATGGAGAVVGLGAFGQYVAGAIGGGLTGAVLEGALEAGGVYDQALDQGMTVEEAQRAADSVFAKNVAMLAGSNTLELAVAFAPTPFKIGERLIAKGWVTAARIGGKMVITGFTEAGEEVYQEMVLRQALGLEVDFSSPEMKEVAAIGGIMGIGLGGGGDILMQIINNTKARATPEQMAQWEQTISTNLNSGMSAKSAEIRAFYSMTESDGDVLNSAKEVFEEVKQDEALAQVNPADEVEQVAWDHIKQQVQQQRLTAEQERASQAISGLPLEERETMRDGMKRNLADLEESIWKQKQEIEALQEELVNDPVADFRFDFGRRKNQPLTVILDKWGDWKESFTVKEAEAFLLGRKLRPEAIDQKTGRVPWEYLIDELAGQMKMTEDQLRDRIKYVWRSKRTIQAFRDTIFSDEMEAQRIRGMLEASEARPVRQVEGTPEAGVQTDMFGGERVVTPQGKGVVTQISMDDQMKLQKAREEAKVKPKPKVTKKKGITITETPAPAAAEVEATPAESREETLRRLNQKAYEKGMILWHMGETELTGEATTKPWRVKDTATGETLASFDTAAEAEAYIEANYIPESSQAKLRAIAEREGEAPPPNLSPPARPEVAAPAPKFRIPRPAEVPTPAATEHFWQAYLSGKGRVFATLESAWGSLTISERTELVKAAGLEGQVASKAYQKLTEAEYDALMRGATPTPTPAPAPVAAKPTAEAGGVKIPPPKKPKAEKKAKPIEGVAEPAAMTETLYGWTTEQVEGPFKSKDIFADKVPSEAPPSHIDPGKIPAKIAANIPMMKDIGILEKLRPARQVFQKIGLRQEIFEPAFAAEQKVYTDLQEFRKQLKETVKLVAKGRRVAIFRELENPGSQTDLSTNEEKAIKWFRGYFDKWADDLKLPKDKRRSNYVTHIFEQDIRQQLQDKYPIDPALVKALDWVSPKTIFDPFLQERLGRKIGLREDPFAAAEAYETRALRVFHYQPLLDRISVYEKYAPPSAAQYLRDYKRRMAGTPLALDRDVSNTLKDFAKALERAGVPGADALAAKWEHGNAASMLAHQYTSMLYFLWLGFKPTSAIRNLSQNFLTIAETGPMDFVRGQALRLTKGGKAALAKSLVLEARHQAYVPGIDTAFQTMWTNRVRDTSLWMFRQADRVNVSSAFLAGYAEGKRLGMSEEWAVKRGDEVAADTQYIYTTMGGAQWSQPAIGRVLSVLTTWPTNFFELVGRWVQGRPSYVLKEYEAATGQKVAPTEWISRYKSLIIFASILALAYAIQRKTRVRALEYTGITSLNYIADVLGGQLPALEWPGAVAKIAAGYATQNDFMIKEGMRALDPKWIMGAVGQIDGVISGERDWLRLLIYMDAQPPLISQLRQKWSSDFEAYDALDLGGDRNDYRWRNPEIEAKLFMTGRVSRLTTDDARYWVGHYMSEYNIKPDMIAAYSTIFETDTAAIFEDAVGMIGSTYEDLVEGQVQDLRYTTTTFAAEVNKYRDLVGRQKIYQDGNELAIAYLDAQDMWQAYYNLPAGKARDEFRASHPEAEAWMIFWGRFTTYESDETPKLLFDLMEQYDIEPAGIRAFNENMEKYYDWQEITEEEPEVAPISPRPTGPASHPSVVYSGRQY